MRKNVSNLIEKSGSNPLFRMTKNIQNFESNTKQVYLNKLSTLVNTSLKYSETSLYIGERHYSIETQLEEVAYGRKTDRYSKRRYSDRYSERHGLTKQRQDKAKNETCLG